MKILFRDIPAGLPEAGLEPGHWLEIAAHEKHGVAWTDPNGDTVWLAVHYLRERLQPR